MRRRKWTDHENDMMLKLIQEYGPDNWSFIASKMNGRTGKQCRDHYINVLDPNIKRVDWTLEEDNIILKKFTEYGAKWSSIVEFLPGRTQSMIKNRCKYLLQNDRLNYNLDVEDPNSFEKNPDKSHKNTKDPLDIKNLLNFNHDK